MNDLVWLPIGLAIGGFLVLAFLAFEKHREPLNSQTWSKMSKWRKRAIIRGLAGRYNFGSGS